MYQILPTLDVKFILSRLTEEDIFSRYLCPVTDSPGTKICNPMREDHSPTCRFYKDNAGRLVFHDYGGYFHGDCFEVVKFQYNVNFNDALAIIARDFGLLDPKTISNYKILTRTLTPNLKAKTIIKVKRREWSHSDKAFWKSFHLTRAILEEYQVAPLQTVWINGLVNYQHNYNDPGYVYYFGNGDYKLYFPNRREYRFMCNTSKLQGYNQLPSKGDLLIITKALKDVMVYKRLGLVAVAPQAEGHIIKPEEYTDLSGRFKQIFTNFDFDRTGCRTAFKMKEMYKIKPLFLTNGKFQTKDYGAKDISDYIRNFGYESTMELIRETYNNVIE